MYIMILKVTWPYPIKLVAVSYFGITTVYKELHFAVFHD